jgi:hypothetical protein
VWSVAVPAEQAIAEQNDAAVSYLDPVALAVAHAELDRLRRRRTSITAAVMASLAALGGWPLGHLMTQAAHHGCWLVSWI